MLGVHSDSDKSVSHDREQLLPSDALQTRSRGYPHKTIIKTACSYLTKVCVMNNCDFLTTNRVLRLVTLTSRRGDLREKPTILAAAVNYHSKVLEGVLLDGQGTGIRGLGDHGARVWGCGNEVRCTMFTRSGMGGSLDRSMDSDKYLEGKSMQRPPLFESDSFIYWKNRFETYVKSKDLDLWHVITNGDFQPIIQNPETKLDEVVPFEKQTDDLKRRLAKNNEAKMVIYNALPRKEYE
ncbi:hypothetical protein Tco_1568961 [Tanacetum coccineum]